MSRTFYFCGENDKRPGVRGRVMGIVLAGAGGRTGAAVWSGRMEDVDNAARRVIAEAGYGKYFTHRTGARDRNRYPRNRALLPVIKV